MTTEWLMMKEVIAALILAVCFTAIPVLATDYPKMEKSAENLLLDPAYNLGITSANVSINPQQVTH
jgi:hypothetical protein